MEKSKKRICWIRVLKNISYCIAPILVIFLILCIISVVYVYRTAEVRENIDYFSTDSFAEQYANSLYNQLTNIKYEKENSLNKEEQQEQDYDYYLEYYLRTNDVEGKEEKIAYRFNYARNNFIYLCIDKETGIAYTNVDSSLKNSTIIGIKNTISENDQKWYYENGKITTSIEPLEQEYIQYHHLYNSIKDGNYEIYTALLNELPYYDGYLEASILYTVAQNLYQNSIYYIPILAILLIVMIPIVLIGIGKTAKEERIHLNSFDKWPIELSTSLLILLGFIGCCVGIGIGYEIGSILQLIFIAFGLGICYLACILFLETFVKRLKTHTFFKTTFAYWTYQKAKLVFDNFNVSLKVGILFAGFVIANWIIFAMASSESFWAFILLMLLYAFSFIYVLKRVIWFHKIQEAIRKVYEGNTDIYLNVEEFKGEMRKFAIYVNDIAGGLSNAVNEKLKSERLKTELITNVSHDIKTPLTSIINYVDLLKKEDVTNEKAQEYLMVLDSKSQRLKKLTEDLVEASKASSGNIKLNMERLNVNELMKQISGEFEDKFKARGLEEISSFPQNQMYIKADSRYLYRVLENMYSNVAKYAMENTRVYTDVIEHGNNVIIQIKNVSKEKLNISSEELMQRFVRGDSSRNTEGSGLGLSIATSLTELQGGKFHIYLDGDLFKITIGFERMKGE